MKRAKTLILSTLLAGGFGLAAAAQVQVPQQRAPNMPAPENTIPDKIEPSDPPATGSTESLSEKLQKSDGVIKPRTDTTPDMSVPAPVPDPGTTRVIPPPGSPGGNQSVNPK
jgi:hypothetical protein